MDTLIIVSLILNILILIALGLVIFLLNKKMAEDAQRAKDFSAGLARLDKHFKIGEQLLAKKLKEHEDNIQKANLVQTRDIKAEIEDVRGDAKSILNEVKELSKYEELR